ncbi:MAG: flavin monoamine oxidase family protein [Verrucomicrobiales bacterium]
MNPGHTPLARLTRRWLHQSFAPSASRRQFLRTAGLATAGGLLIRPAAGQDEAAPPAPAPTRKPDGPVAIIGGGMAGLTAALRLQQAGVECEIFEGSERFGGRMMTRKNFNDDGMFCELGGELVDSNHTDLIELAKELGLEIQSLREGEKGVDFYHFNGKTYTDTDLIPLFAPLAERIAKDAEALYTEEEDYTERAKQLDKVSLSEYLERQGAGIEKWILQMLTAAYTIEYGLDTDKQSSLNLVDFIATDTSAGFKVFGDSDEAWRVKGGNEGLPQATLGALTGKVPVHVGHRWVAVAKEGEGLKCSFAARSGIVSRTFGHVVCAIPFTLLREVRGWPELGLSDDKQRSIREMGYGSNLKIMYGFKSRPWRAPRPDGIINNGNLYADLAFQTVWETSRGQSGDSGILTNFMGGTKGSQYDPSRLDAFLSELDRVFTGLKLQHDSKRVMMNWPSMRWVKASYSAPLVGQYTWVLAAAATPELDGRLVFAGEHTSENSAGYMNGAVESGNRAARELLGQAKPA